MSNKKLINEILGKLDNLIKTIQAQTNIDQLKIDSKEVIVQLQIELKAKLQRDTKKLDDLRNRTSRWQGILMEQLSYFNNLLIILGTAFLGFVFKDSKVWELTPSLNYEIKPTILFWVITSVSLSVFLGLLCGFNRLIDFRITHKIINLRKKLYRDHFEDYGESKSDERIMFFVYYWFCTPQAFQIKDEDFENNCTGYKNKIGILKKISDNLGIITRRFLRLQVIFFLIFIVLLALIFIISI